MHDDSSLQILSDLDVAKRSSDKFDLRADFRALSEHDKSAEADGFQISKNSILVSNHLLPW